MNMNAVRAARIERFTPTHVDELSSEPPADTHGTRTEDDTNAERQRGPASGANTIHLGTRTDANTNAEQQRGAESGVNTIPLGTRTDTNTNAEQQCGTVSGANTIPIDTRAGNNTDGAQRFLREMWPTLMREHTGGW